MKALTVLQPWASAIALGAKRIETRHWSTKYRGPLLIHAGKSRAFVPREIQGFGSNERSQIGYPVLGMLGLWDQFHDDTLPLGAIVAVARLVTVLPLDGFSVGCYYRVWDEHELDGTPLEETPPRTEFTFQEQALGDFSPGRYGWVLADVRPLAQPIPWKGAQGLFDVPTGQLIQIWKEQGLSDEAIVELFPQEVRS